MKYPDKYKRPAFIYPGQCRQRLQTYPNRLHFIIGHLPEKLPWYHNLELVPPACNASRHGGDELLFRSVFHLAAPESDIEDKAGQ